MRIQERWEHQTEIKNLVGKRVLAVNGLKAGSEAADFLLSDGSIFEMAYHHDCCASCDILDLDCEPADFIDQEILAAEEVSSELRANGLLGWFQEHAPADEYPPESYTWTFVKFTTPKGHFTIRWYGESNGYYSESPSYTLLPADEARGTLTDAEQVLLDRAEEKGWR